jgi:hypothetical protein
MGTRLNYCKKINAEYCERNQMVQKYICVQMVSVQVTIKVSTIYSRDSNFYIFFGFGFD